MANMNRTKVITGINTKLSYFHGWEPVSINGVTHFDVSREKSVQAITQAMKKDQKVFLDAVNKAIDAAIEEGCCKIRR